MAAGGPPAPGPAGDGPTVVSLLRYGYHMLPTTLVLTFDQALAATTAQDAQAYRIIGPRGRTIRVRSAVYDPASLTVTLHPTERLNFHCRFELIVDGTAPNGLTNLRGQLLDGAASGTPGSDYRAPLTRRNLVVDSPGPKPCHPARPTTGNLKPKSAPARSVHH
jgi:hypothetical protein